MKVTAHRCVGEDCFDELIAEETCQYEDIRTWSDPKSWDQSKNEETGEYVPASERVDNPIPQAGDSFVIPVGFNMAYDLDVSEDGTEPPLFEQIELNGCLHFPQGQDVKLRAKKILIRGGEFYIGSEEARYTNNAIISLEGSVDDTTLAIEDQGIEAGTKIIANIGRLNFWGKERSFKMTRLLAPVEAGATTITVDSTDVDLVEGDMIAIAPTGIEYDTGETKTVVSYSNGVITLDSALEYYHFGAAESTGADFNGVDMRGEVLSLSRNIKIIGDEVDDLGAQILTADVMEFDGTMREGKTVLDSIEVIYGGVKDKRSAAIRFEGATTNSQKVKNSSIHNGPGWMFNGLRSRNLNIDNNVFWGGNQVGVGMNNVMAV